MTPPEAPQPHRSPADRLAAIVLTVLGVLAGLVSLFVAPFFAMTPTVCGPGECSGSTVVWASVVSWAGVGLAAVLAVAGMVSAARRRQHRLQRWGSIRSHFVWRLSRNHRYRRR